MGINPYILLGVLALILLGMAVLAVRLFMNGLHQRQRREPSAAPRRTGPIATDYYARTLRQAAEVVGGEADLATTLKVPPEALRRWLAGEESPPIEVHLAALDLVTRGAPKAKAE